MYRYFVYNDHTTHIYKLDTSKLPHINNLEVYIHDNNIVSGVSEDMINGITYVKLSTRRVSFLEVTDDEFNSLYIGVTSNNWTCDCGLFACIGFITGKNSARVFKKTNVTYMSTSNIIWQPITNQNMSGHERGTLMLWLTSM